MGKYDRRRKKYGLGKFFLDLMLTLLTGGLWLLWLLLKFLRANS